MITIRNIILVSQALLLAHNVQANEPTEPINTFKYNIDLSFEGMRDVIESAADATLNPDGSLLQTNCKKNAHCVVLSYNFGCKAATFSTYESTNVKETIQELALLHDFDIKPNKTCKTIDVGGQCSNTRCVFSPTAAVSFN